MAAVCVGNASPLPEAPLRLGLVPSSLLPYWTIGPLGTLYGLLPLKSLPFVLLYPRPWHIEASRKLNG